MEQYIQKSALVEEIEKWLGETDKGFPNDHNLGRYDICKKMLSFIDTLEVKEQMMAKAVDATVHIEAGNYPYIPQIELYDYDKDVPLAKEGDKYKVVLIKED